MGFWHNHRTTQNQCIAPKIGAKATENKAQRGTAAQRQCRAGRDCAISGGVYKANIETGNRLAMHLDGRIWSLACNGSGLSQIEWLDQISREAEITKPDFAFAAALLSETPIERD
jgi:hypothetical protein